MFGVVVHVVVVVVGFGVIEVVVVMICGGWVVV